MSNYIVLGARSLEDAGSEGLTSQVNRFLAMGYIPVGGLATRHDGMFLQAVMKPLAAGAASGGRRSLRKSRRSRR